MKTHRLWDHPISRKRFRLPNLRIENISTLAGMLRALSRSKFCSKDGSNTRGSLFFLLRNLKLHLEGQVVGLDLDVQSFARNMGHARAIMHWAAKKDGRDIEFVSGLRKGEVLTLDARHRGSGHEQA